MLLAPSSANGLSRRLLSEMAVRICRWGFCLLLTIGTLTHARDIDISAEHRNFYSFHGQSCDQTFRDIAPYVGHVVRVQVGVWNVYGLIHGMAETPEHIVRLFIGPEVVTFIAGESLSIAEEN